MTERLGSYELERHLATGGMAEVFVGRRVGTRERIALKCILPHLAREERFISMFLDEARIAARLQHPNIVKIHELGDENGEYFIAMELIDGGDLADLLDRADEQNVEMPIALSVRIITDILAALDYAHEFAENGKPMRIVHRDVSPHNVLIGRDGAIKLVDFGIAHAVERHAKTETGIVKGKLSYMAPEQVEQRGVDRRADIFSAGALLYELLTGEPPFGRDLAAVNAVLNEPAPNPQERRPEVPDELVRVIHRALEKDPDDRYGTAREMADALEAVLDAYGVVVSAGDVAQFATALHAGETPCPLPELARVPRSSTALVSTPYLRDISTPPVPTDAAAAQPSPVRYFTAAAVMLVAVGAAIAVLGSTREPMPPSEPEVVLAAPPEPERTEPTEVGFAFNAEELELAQLERWVATLDDAQVDRMLEINFERPDEHILWSVWGPLLAQEIAGPPGPIDPSDPASVARLGDPIEVPPAARATRTRRTRVTATPTTLTTVAAPQPQPQAAKAAKKPRKRKNDLRIIDRAVPY